MELFEILLVVGTILYYVFRGSGDKKQKPKAKRPVSQPASQEQRPQKTERTLEEILRDLTEPKPAPKVEPVKAEVKKVEETPKYVSLENTPRHSHHPHVFERFEAYEIDEDPDGSDIDLRQAVIYDAILNRPKHFDF